MAALTASVTALSLLLRSAKEATALLCDLIQETTPDRGNRLLLAYAQVSLDYSIATFEDAAKAATHESMRYLDREQWNREKSHRLYRLLMRTAYAVQAAIDPRCFPNYEQLRVGRVRVNTQAVCLTRILRPGVYKAMPCVATTRPGIRRMCGSGDHVHDEEGLIWPNDARALEGRHLVTTSRTVPSIAFRDFRYKIIRPQPASDNALQSAVDAMERTITKAHQWPERASISLGVEECAAVEARANQFNRSLPGLLACVGFYAWMHYRRSVPEFRLGIISPGTSEIFWLGGSTSMRNTVYIQAEYACKDGQPTYRFLGIDQVIHTNPALPGSSDQTVEFLDLPAELRNRIYGYYIDAQPAVTMPNRQPALSLACRQVNKELLGLLFKKHAWIVYG
ncbi:hypothetical protein LTR15_011541 [Elasticomyces elasticus]|nr:hypothetical protein LTR15_011541 [Elasticomyces elasticus]